MDQTESNICSVEPVVLDVGGRKFHTSIGTLTAKSDFFAAFFSGRWEIPKQADGSIFIDAGPDLFEHIILYLRHGIFPLAWDTSANMHDIQFYHRLTPLARYFQIPMLDTWLTDELWSKCLHGRNFIKAIDTEALDSGKEIDLADCWGDKLLVFGSSLVKHDEDMHFDPHWDTDYGDYFVKYWEEKIKKASVADQAKGEETDAEQADGDQAEEEDQEEEDQEEDDDHEIDMAETVWPRWRWPRWTRPRWTRPRWTRPRWTSLRWVRNTMQGTN